MSVVFLGSILTAVCASLRSDLKQYGPNRNKCLWILIRLPVGFVAFTSVQITLGNAWIHILFQNYGLNSKTSFWENHCYSQNIDDAIFTWKKKYFSQPKIVFRFKWPTQCWYAVKTNRTFNNRNQCIKILIVIEFHERFLLRCFRWHHLLFEMFSKLIDSFVVPSKSVYRTLKWTIYWKVLIFTYLWILQTVLKIFGLLQFHLTKNNWLSSACVFCNFLRKIFVFLVYIFSKFQLYILDFVASKFCANTINNIWFSCICCFSPAISFEKYDFLLLVSSATPLENT